MKQQTEKTDHSGSEQNGGMAKKPLLRLVAGTDHITCLVFDKIAFHVEGDRSEAETLRKVVFALREMLIHLPPEDGAKIVERGIAVCFDAPDLVKLIETELAMKVVSGK